MDEYRVENSSTRHHHEQFAWLHRISELVVQIDEMLKQMNQYRWTMSKI